MLHGPLAGKILAVALPLAAMSILQQLFNAADVAVVGQFASSNALAAVGANTPIINMFLTLFTGLATGGNVAIATYIGRGIHEKVQDAVNTVFTLSLICAGIVVVVGQLAARPLLLLVNTPDTVLDQAVLYLRIYLFAMMFAVIYNYASAILRSKGDTRRPLYCLVASGILNVLLNLFFVIICKMDVAGVAIATLIANAVCAGATVILLLKEETPFRISFRRLHINKDIFRFTMRIGLPAGLQGMLFSVSNIVIQSGINSFGTECIAGNTAAMNFEFIAYFMINAFSQTITTFVSQNYGAGNYARCKKAFWMSYGMGSLGSFAIGSCFFFFGSFWLSLFTSSQEAIAFGMIRMTFIVFLEILTGTYEMPGAAMRGMGVSLLPSIITFLGSCVFRIIWVNTIFQASHELRTLLIVYPVSWILMGLVMFPIYFFIRRKKCKSLL